MNEQAIAVLSVRRGEGDAIALCDVKVGGMIIRRVAIRPGPNGQIYVDMPSQRQGDDWIDLVEITSVPLAERVREVVLSSIGEPAQ